MGHRDRTGGRARLHLVIWLELGQDLGLPGGGGPRSTFPRRALSLVTVTAKWARAALPPRTASGDSGKSCEMRRRRQRRPLPQSSSASRCTAGAAGFLNLSQSLVRPER